MTRTKLIRAALAAVLVFAVLLAVLYTAAEASHDCAGDGCLICAMIGACEITVKSLFCAAATLISVALIYGFYITSDDRGEFFSAASPVSLKTKLLN